MTKQKVDPVLRKAIQEARKFIIEAARMDINEADTRKRVDRIFHSVMGYDTFKHLTSEYAVRGPGETEYCDFVIQFEEGDGAKPIIFVELKRVNIDLAKKHLRQVSSYAINAGCEWILLTNGREWRLYHVSFGKPPETKLVDTWNLLHDAIPDLVDKFALLSFRQVKKNTLDEVWRKANILTHRNILSAMLSEDAIKLIRRQLKKTFDVLVSPEEIIAATRKLLNETAIAELESICFTLSKRKSIPRKKSSKK